MNYKKIQLTLISSIILLLLTVGIYSLYNQLTTIDASRTSLQAENIRFPKQISENELMFFSGYNFHILNLESGQIKDLSTPVFFPRVDQLKYSSNNDTVIFRATNYEDDDVLNKLLPTTNEYSPQNLSDWWSYSISEKKPSLLKCGTDELIESAFFDRDTIYLQCRKNDDIIIRNINNGLTFATVKASDLVVGINDSRAWIIRKEQSANQLGYLNPNGDFTKIDEPVIASVIAQTTSTLYYQTGSVGEDQDEPAKLKKVSLNNNKVSILNDKYVGGLQEDYPAFSQIFLNIEIRDNQKDTLEATELVGSSKKNLRFKGIKLREYTQWYRFIVNKKEIIAALDTDNNLWLINPSTEVKAITAYTYHDSDIQPLTKSILLSGPTNNITASLVGTDFEGAYMELSALISSKGKDIRTTRVEFFSNPQSIGSGDRILNFED